MKIKNLVKRLFNKCGLEISYMKSSFTMNACLQRCRKRGININTVIDVGASNGSWSTLCTKWYPEAFYLLIEANSIHKAHLEKLKRYCGDRMDYVISVAGSKIGKIYFDNRDPYGGLASNEPINGAVEMPVTTIDAEVKKKILYPPFLIKLDTHGFEVPILEGSHKILKDTELVIMEAYNFKIADECLKFYEMCLYMEKLGFRPIDITDLMIRKADASLWQMDIFFMRANRKEFFCNSYE